MRALVLALVACSSSEPPYNPKHASYFECEDTFERPRSCWRGQCLAAHETCMRGQCYPPVCSYQQEAWCAYGTSGIGMGCWQTSDECAEGVKNPLHGYGTGCMLYSGADVPAH